MRKLAGMLACVAVITFAVSGCEDEVRTTTRTEQIHQSEPQPAPQPVRETVYESEPHMVSPGQEVVE